MWNSSFYEIVKYLENNYTLSQHNLYKGSYIAQLLDGSLIGLKKNNMLANFQSNLGFMLWYIFEYNLLKKIILGLPGILGNN